MPRNVQMVVVLLLLVTLVADVIGALVVPGHMPSVVIDGGILTVFGAVFGLNRGPKPDPPDRLESPPVEQSPDDGPQPDPTSTGRHTRRIS